MKKPEKYRRGKLMPTITIYHWEKYLMEFTGFEQNQKIPMKDLLKTVKHFLNLRMNFMVEFHAKNITIHCDDEQRFKRFYKGSSR